MKSIRICCLLCMGLLLAAPMQMNAQQRFNAGILLGLNAAQINGDASAGYNKLGVRAGVRGIVNFTEKAEITMDLLYSQRGSQSELSSGNVGLQRSIIIHYVEVPVQFVYKDWWDEDYFRVQAFGGLSFSRLVSTRLKEYPELEELTPYFNNNDIGITIGAAYYIGPHFGIGARYSRSINRLLNLNKVPDNLILSIDNPLVGYFLSFEGIYVF